MSSKMTLFVHSMSISGHVEAVSLEYNNKRLFALYRSPRCSDKTLKEFVNKYIIHDNICPTLVFGDFNENFLSVNNINTFMQNVGYTSLLQPCLTTRGGTHLDNVFGNFTCEAGIYYSLFSYHKPIWARVH